MKDVLQIIENWVIDRPVLHQNNLDPKNAIQLIQSELDELKTADEEEIPRELADIVWMCFNYALLNGIDIEKEIREKAAFNMIRYQAKDWQEGDYAEIRKMTKQREKDLHLHDEFYSIDQ